METKLPGVRANIVKNFLNGSKSVDEFAAYFTENAFYRFGNAPPIIGRQNIRDSSVKFRQRVKSVAHDIQSMWEMGDVVICQMDVIYTRHDGQVFTVPCTDIIRMEGNLFQDVRIYIDTSIVFA